MEERAQAVRDLLGDDLGVEGLGEGPREAGQGLGRLAPFLRLREEPRVAHGHRSLGGEGHEQRLVVIPEKIFASEVQGQHAEELAARHHGHAGEGVEPVAHGPVRDHDARVPGHVLDEERAALSGDPPHRTLIERDLGGQVHGVNRNVGGPRATGEAAPSRVGHPEDHGPRARERGQRERDLLEEGLQVELLRERHVDIGQRPEPPLPRLESSRSAAAIVDGAVEQLGQLGQLVLRRHGDGRPRIGGQLARAAHERTHGAVHPVADQPRHEQGQHHGGGEPEQIALESGGGRPVRRFRGDPGDHEPRRSAHAGRAGEEGDALPRSPLRDTAATTEHRARLRHRAQIPAQESTGISRARENGAPRRGDGQDLITAEGKHVEVEGQLLEVQLGRHQSDGRALPIVDGHDDGHHRAIACRCAPGGWPAARERCDHGRADARRPTLQR